MSIALINLSTPIVLNNTLITKVYTGDEDIIESVYKLKLPKSPVETYTVYIDKELTKPLNIIVSSNTIYPTTNEPLHLRTKK